MISSSIGNASPQIGPALPQEQPALGEGEPPQRGPRGAGPWRRARAGPVTGVVIDIVLLLILSGRLVAACRPVSATNASSRLACSTRSRRATIWWRASAEVTAVSALSSPVTTTRSPGGTTLVTSGRLVRSASSRRPGRVEHGSAARRASAR